MNKQFLPKLLALPLFLSMVLVTLVRGFYLSNGGYYGVYVDTTVRVNEPVSSDGTIEVKVVNGKATVALNAKAVESLADLAKNGEIALEIEAEGATKVDVSFPAKALTEVAKETGADLTIKSPVAVITIPNAVLANEFTGFGNMKVSAQATGSSVGFSIQADGKALQNIKGLKVEF